MFTSETHGMCGAVVQHTLQENKRDESLFSRPESWSCFVLCSDVTIFYLLLSFSYAHSLFPTVSIIYTWHLLEWNWIPGSPLWPPIYSSPDIGIGREDSRSRENRGENKWWRKIPSFLLSPGGIKLSDAELADKPTPASWSLHGAFRESIASFLSAVRLHKRVASPLGCS